MGLLAALLTAPLAPVRGVVWVADQLAEAADREVNDPVAVRARLAALNRALEDGEIDLVRFEREEDRLLDLLEARTGLEVAG
ncbi:gas vesicle protein GvpG [Streptomyces sp. NA02536]|uniref:gas vesicle protein GvpG n=1 Tax=Streptomyces sp. NA02536 TaxID=2742133 RepID=UPI001591DFD8|nr:gas vesicle protein GvpG [Streptomyces sp. NA02536]QKV98374.1 gas vesicle protein GvpG [Streptomyces sp. NA02536]